MKVLVIDDDRMTVLFVLRALTEDGHTVDSAATGAEGVMQARVNPYDAIVLDFMLPDTTGPEVVKRLREESCTVPVLMLTGKTTTDARILGLDAGADDYLTKPFDVGELKARLRAITRRGPAVRTEEIQIGALLLDRIAHEIRIAGKRLRLTPKEYRLLEYFVLRPDRVVTRTDLLEHVWDMHFDPQSNVVDAHVARVRAKLRKVPDAPQLETVRGFGFRLLSTTIVDP